MSDAHVVKLSYSVTEAVEATSLGRSTIFELIRSGELESFKFMGRRLIPADALHALINKQRMPQSGRAA
ncbi:helix-turn-helix domain-containing protein [Streptomyces sp. MS191]|uniref:helix-turn-helix domain-containing protein n=1 Tax=Streptomyces sp. ms191 TaxID=1827978 RepID=UPI0021C981B1|nr:helix-turn-helix domain-containing protein [Streptomyces sp. ms191]